MIGIEPVKNKRKSKIIYLNNRIYLKAKNKKNIEQFTV